MGVPAFLLQTFVSPIRRGLPYLCRKDMLGNILALLDGSGNIVVQYKYDAWGNHTVTDANGNAITDADHIGNLNPFRYRGYYFDRETGFYFLQSRYYDPEVGRFLNMDSIEYADPESVNGINLYSYCGNNPVMGVDPMGTWDWSAIGNFFINVGKVIAGAVLAVAGAAMAAANFLPALVSPSSTVACEVGLSVGMYGVAMVGSVVSSDINADMERINWNPFNNNAEAAAQASVFSFYKGVPVVIIDREDDRSGSFGIIFLDKDDRDADTIRHEYGHVPQLMMLGIARFAFCIGIPSSQQWGVGSSWEYYNAPWEASADFFGGVKQSQASEEAVKRSMKYLLCSYFFGPFVHAFYKKIK